MSQIIVTHEAYDPVHDDDIITIERLFSATLAFNKRLYTTVTFVPAQQVVCITTAIFDNISENGMHATVTRVPSALPGARNAVAMTTEQWFRWMADPTSTKPAVLTYEGDDLDAGREMQLHIIASLGI